MEELNQELDSKLNDLNNEIEIEYKASCEYYSDDDYFTHCDICERNCHDFCDCFTHSLDKCKIFTWGVQEDKICEECQCTKDKHKMDHYRWIKKSINKKKDNANKINEEREKNRKEKERYLEELNKKKNEESNLDKQINELNYNRNKLNLEKANNINDINNIQKKIWDNKNKLTFIIIKLKIISFKIDDITMNNNRLKTEEEYIDSLEDIMNEIGIRDEEQKRLLKELKNYFKVFRETNKLDDKELMKLDDSQLAAKLNIIIPKSKKNRK